MRPSKFLQIIEGKAVEKRRDKIPLTADEATRFRMLKENIRESQFLVFSEQFRAAEWLWEINNDRLYRQDYDTFEEFCRKELSIQRRRAYQIIEVAGVVRELPENVQHVAQNLRQVAELVKVCPGQRANVLIQASEAANRENKPLTAKMIRDMAVKLGVLQKLLTAPEQGKGAAKPAETKERIQARKLCDAWRRACRKVRRDFMIALSRDSDFKSVASMIVEDDRLLARD